MPIVTITGTLFLMRALTALVLSAAFLSSPALAVVKGKVVRDPNGLRGSVVRVETSNGELCSGALIRPDLVLTAAHCVTDRASYRVVAVDRSFRPLAVRAVAAVVHPSFVAGTTPRTQPGVDLAMLKLERPVGPGFAPLDPSAGRVESGDSVTLAGFGVIAEGQKASARTLREAPLVALGPMQISNRVLVTADRQRLAETAGAGACRGDSGGPILAETRGGYRLVGIVSWSSGAIASRSMTACGGLTAVTPLAEHRRWIVEGASALDQFSTGAFGDARAGGRDQWAR